MSTEPEAKKNRSVLYGIQIIVPLIIVVILIALLYPAVKAARESARCMQCGCGCVKLAFYNYHDTYDVFPPAFIPEPVENSR